MPALTIAEHVDLAPLCTLGLGGPARFFADVAGEEELREALGWAAAAGLPVALLGGGSNVVIADEGFPGLVLRLKLRGVSLVPAGDLVHVTARAGEPWDDLVQRCLAAGLAGLECLSGIPGSAGATPIQNVGAYGQEVADTISSVRVLDRRTLAVAELAPAECAFAYRTSRFKRDPERHVVLSVTFTLRRGAPDAPRHAELGRALGPGPHTLGEVRAAVLALRRQKSMVIDPTDENRRSVGSFFMNPVLPAAAAAAVVARAVALGLARAPDEVPRYPAPDGQVKLAAAWLIERAGVRRGQRHGPVGVSSRHTLALVHHGGGRAADLIALARAVQAAVGERFGVTLRPEPLFLGFPTPPL